MLGRHRILELSSVLVPLMRLSEMVTNAPVSSVRQVSKVPDCPAVPAVPLPQSLPLLRNTLPVGMPHARSLV